MHAAILLVAGRSSRMGSLKGLIEWQGKLLVVHQIEQLLKSKIEQMIVVLGYQSEVYQPIISELGSSVTIVWNENWEQGKSSSILKGITALPKDCRSILFVNIDQPLQFSVVNQLIDSFEQTKSPIHLPIFHGKRGHPLLISCELLPALSTINEEEQGLKKIIRAYQKDIRSVEVDDPHILYNFNTPKDMKGE
ncbi:nucleotidyltransferase family protein [Thermoflavimicrobium daqui]|nr:nucleotidyltransferase family protein [Thermoflavimicrobium daqui]